MFEGEAWGRRQKKKNINKELKRDQNKKKTFNLRGILCGQNCFVVSTPLWGIPRSMSLNYNILFNKSYFFFIATTTDATV